MIELAGDAIKIKKRKQSVYKERNISTNHIF